MNKFKCILKAISDVRKNNFLFYKGLTSLKKHGIKYTLNKISLMQNNMDFTCNFCTESELEKQKRTQFVNKVKFSILVPLYNTPIDFLKEMIESVIAQTYYDWELCLVDASNIEYYSIRDICGSYAKQDERIKYHKINKNLGISENTNMAASLATGDYFVLLDHDDCLMPNALYENRKIIDAKDPDVIYSDEDHLSIKGKHINPFFKPDWSIDLLYSQNYICHLLVFKSELFQKLNGFQSKFDGSQDYDFILRISEITNKIYHIPQILYSWRESATSTAVNSQAKPYAYIAGLNALDAHLKRKYGEDVFAEESNYIFCYNARFNQNNVVLVSIIIPMKDKWEITEQCVQSILRKSSYQNFEIIILDNNSKERDTLNWLKHIQLVDKRIRVEIANIDFNWSKLNNYGISKANGEVYIFLNNDTLVSTPDWIERLSENALRKDIGIVGALLLYEDCTIQHAGVVVGMNDWADHVFKGMKLIHHNTPFVSPVISRNVLAVTGACMAISKDTINKIGLFNEDFIICGSDVEICIRAFQYGLLNRYDANTKLYHLESKTRDSFIPAIDFEKSRIVYDFYKKHGDPFFNSNLDLMSIIPRGRKLK